MVGLVISGWYAVDIGYMSRLQKPLLDWHQAVGIAVFGLGGVFVLWHLVNRPPAHIESLSSLERLAARCVHIVLYTSLFAIPLTGYIAATEDGPLNVFGVDFAPLPATDWMTSDELALALHWYFGYGLAGLAILHAAAALKHHVVNRDATLSRMMGRASNPAQTPDIQR